MKFRHVFASLVLALSILVAVPIGGCFGNAARDNVGAPALVLAQEGVVGDARSGIATLPAADQPTASTELATFEAAIATKDRAVIAADALPRWTSVRAWAEAGIAARLAAGQIGPGVAASLRERLDRFGEVLTKVSASPGS